MEILPEEAARLSGKQHMLRLIKILKEDESYFSEFMMHFYIIPSTLQRSFLNYIVEQVGSTTMESQLQDEYQWRDLVKSVLMFFSGLKKDKGVDQPNKEELMQHMADFIKSGACEKADKDELEKPKVSFADMMEVVHAK